MLVGGEKNVDHLYPKTLDNLIYLKQLQGNADVTIHKGHVIILLVSVALTLIKRALI